MDTALRKKYELSPEKLRYNCDSKEFKSTKQIEPGLEAVIIGQEKAVEAIQTGLKLNDKYSNIFVTGSQGLGKDETIRTVLKQYIEKMSPEELNQKLRQRKEMVAAYNFEKPETPLILGFPQGWGEKFEKDLDAAANYILKEGIKAYEKRFETEFLMCNRKANELDSKLKKQEKTIAEEGEKIGLEISKLSKLLEKAILGSKEEKEYQDRINSLRKEYQEKDEDSIQKETKLREEISAIQSQSMVEQKNAPATYKEKIIKPMIDKLKNKYPTKKINSYLEKFEESITKDADSEIKAAHVAVGSKLSGMMMMQMPAAPDMSPYKVKVLNKLEAKEQINGVPVIFEKSPTLENMFGTVEASKYLLTPVGTEKPKKDHHLRMQAGSFMKALGGYLVVSMMKMAQKDLAAFERLIEDLDSESTKIENARLKYYVPTVSEEVRSNIKVIINGNNSVYQQLKSLSKDEFFEEFNKTFNIKSEFDNTTDNNKESREQYSKYIARLCKRKGLKDVTTEGIAEVIEYSTRLTGNQGELTLNIAEIAQVLREANLKAGSNKEITGEHVAEAVKSIRGRHSLIKEKFSKFITKGKMILDTTGNVPNKINGIGVYTLEDIAFGEPMVITAVASLGEGHMVSVDRNAKLTGPIHDKAFGILEGNIRRLFGTDKHTPVNLSLSFEQNYGGVDGDSATVAEFLLTLSALSGEPIYQGIAVTGSLNQLGEVQPIGGVNEKIEGVYDICKAKGLTGSQGVMIPKLNVDQLMLRNDIVQAVEEGKFHIYAVGTPEEAVEVMFGLKAGMPTPGKFEEGTLYHKVNEKIKEYDAILDKKDEKTEEKK